MSFSCVPLIPHAVPAIGEGRWGENEPQVFPAPLAILGGQVQNKKAKARLHLLQACGRALCSLVKGAPGQPQTPPLWALSCHRHEDQALSSGLWGPSGAAAGRP